jgi:hypothetical protein
MPSATQRAFVLLGLVWCVAGASACSVLLDWSGFTGGGVEDGGIDGSVEADAADGADSGGNDATDTGAVGDVFTQDVPAASCSDGGQCMPPVENGWAGPVALYEGSEAGAPTQCPSGFESTPVFIGSGMLDAPPATCASCTCGAPTGATCSDPVMSFFLDPGCSGSPMATVTVSSSCTPTTPGTIFATVAASQATGGTCTGTGGTATVTPPTWGSVVMACAASVSSQACGAGGTGTCSSPPPLPFKALECVMQVGTGMSCPPEYPAGPTPYFTGMSSDTRGCTACCGAPTGAQCSASVNAYMSGCTGSPSSTLAAPTNCAGLIGGEPVELVATPTLTSAGTCPVGGTPTGSLTGTGATTFCCLQ